MSELNYTEEQKRYLAKSGQIAFSLQGFLPDACSWKLLRKDIIEIVARIASKYIDDVKAVSISYESIPRAKNGREDNVVTQISPIAYVWLPKDSPNLVNRDLAKNPNVILNCPIESRSKGVIEFAKRFTLHGQLKLINRNEYRSDGRHNNDLVGIKVMLDKILKVEFDYGNNEYCKQFGNEFRRNVNIVFEIFPSKKPGKFPDIEYMLITKKIEKHVIDNTDLVPSTSRNF